MFVYNCKMCGAPLNIEDGMTVCECEYCGTWQSLPKIGDEKRLAQINRANYFRQNGDFERAERIYEELIENLDAAANAAAAEQAKNSDASSETGGIAEAQGEALAAIHKADAELFWSLALCRYGIEYVTDPATGRKIPTCRRVQYKNILDDDDYRRAVSHADSAQKDLIMSEARYISNVQKGILEISRKEDPYDVFICYKESDDKGNRTKDSVLAQDMYYQLTREGYKVFFARVTLEGKLGTEYEPYIFAALNSAKVMIVLGTKKEHFEATWVKNEWMRYLALMRDDRKRRLIPAYQDMDPYDLPEALSMFQAQDMSKLGSMQDILTVIQNIDQEEREKTSARRETLVVSDVTETAPLLRRIGYFLEDGEFDRAAQYCDRVLNLDPECALAYIYSIMVEKKVHTLDELEQVCDNDGMTADDNYKKAIRFADAELKEKLKRIDQQMIYNDAVNKMQHPEDAEHFPDTVSEFRSIPGFKDADQRLLECVVLKQNLSEQMYAFAERDLERLMRDTQKYPSPFRELAGRYALIAKMKPDPELDELERENMAFRRKTSEEKAMECRYIAAVSELKRASRPDEVNIAYIHLRELGDYKDAQALVKQHKAESKEKEKQRQKAEEDYLRERALSGSGGGRRSFASELGAKSITTTILVIIVIIIIIIGLVTGNLTIGELLESFLKTDLE